MSVFETCYQQISSRKVAAQSVINWTVVGNQAMATGNVHMKFGRVNFWDKIGQTDRKSHRHANRNALRSCFNDRINGAKVSTGCVDDCCCWTVGRRKRTADDAGGSVVCPVHDPAQLVEGYSDRLWLRITRQQSDYSTLTGPQTQLVDVVSILVGRNQELVLKHLCTGHNSPAQHRPILVVGGGGDDFPHTLSGPISPIPCPHSLPPSPKSMGECSLCDVANGHDTRMRDSKLRRATISTRPGCG